MSGPIKRATRVAGRLREELAALLRDLSDPRVQGALISRIEVTDDLQLAKVYVRSELGADDLPQQKVLIRGLEAASKRLRTQLAKALSLRYAPQLRFFYDEGPERAARVEELLREIAAKPESDPDGSENR